MKRGRLWTITALGALTLSIPAQAQEQDVAPVPASESSASAAASVPTASLTPILAAPAPAPAAPAAPDNSPPASAPTPTPIIAPSELATAPVILADSAVDAFYAGRGGAALWFRNADSRAGADRLLTRLRHADLDGFAEGPEAATAIEAAIARGLPDDDKAISVAWVRYVRALKRPVSGISYGDPALALTAPSADAILREAEGAASLSAYVDQVAGVNSFYSALRDAALKQESAADPHVRATLDRLRLLPARGRAILVDVANAQLMMLENGQVVDTMKVIVGKPEAATPLLAGTIHYVTFNPYWHIPQDVARRKVAPIILKRGVSYLKSARYEAVAAFGYDKEVPIDPESVDWKAVADGTAEAHIRQKAGGNNMMGAMKFGFVNDYGIFLHDTPHKDLFAKSRRNLSLGCVRVEKPPVLAHWLLGRDPVPPSDGSEQLVQVDNGVPIYILYLTARPDGEKLAFADDVYGLDAPRQQPAAPVATASASAQR
jgi:murein L,D-transpeptidase YcbB/YkuD